MVARLHRAIAQGKKSAAFWMLIVVSMVVFAVNLSSSRGWLNSSQTWAEESLQTPAGAKSHFREGTELTDLIGKFKIVGDRVVFIETTSNPRSFRCLENLPLQRVYQAIRDEDRDKTWIAQGKVTEYLNENFFLLERVVRAPQAQTNSDLSR